MLSSRKESEATDKLVFQNLEPNNYNLKNTARLEELVLIQSSLLPGELLTFLDDADEWSKLVKSFSVSGDIDSLCLPSSPPRFEIKSTSTRIWFQVQLPAEHPESASNLAHAISVNGENITRVQQVHWQRVIGEKIAELQGTEFIIYQLFTLHILPALHSAIDYSATSPQCTESGDKENTLSQFYHALFTSHHLVSLTKRRSLQQWSSSLSLAGFAKVGYPGVIYAQGRQEDVEEFVTNVKAMQWLALKVRFVQPTPTEGGYGSDTRHWCEFQKVGEVVEEMRRIGREKFVVEMGIGSAGSTG